MFKVLSGVLLSATLSSAFAQEVVWGPNVAVSGSDCSAESVYIMTAGNDISIVMDALALRLSDSHLSDRKSCSVRIPVEIPQGFYLGKLSQSLKYSFAKSEGSSGELAMRTTVFNLPAAQLHVALPYGVAMASKRAIGKLATDFSRSALQLCRGNGTSEGLFAINIAIAGQKDSADESFAVMAPTDERLFSSAGSLELKRCN